MTLVFDFGGVLFNWQPPKLLARTLPQRVTDAASAAHWVHQVFGVPGGGWGDFDRGTVDVPTLVARIAARTGLSPAEVQAVVDAVPDELAPIPESVDLMARLRADSRAAGRPMFYLSNMPAPYADHLERSHGFLRDFDGGVFSARIRLIKPEPEIFAYAAEQFGVPPGELVFLDDHGPNVQAARAAGWRALQFSHAAQAEQDLRANGWWPG